MAIRRFKTLILRISILRREDIKLVFPLDEFISSRGIIIFYKSGKHLMHNYYIDNTTRHKCDERMVNSEAIVL